MKIVVTGAAGFIATNLLERLLADGHPESGQQGNPAGTPEPRLFEQSAELGRRLEADPARIGEPTERGAQRVEPGGPWIDDAVDAAGTQAAVDSGRCRGRVRGLCSRILPSLQA